MRVKRQLIKDSLPQIWNFWIASSRRFDDLYCTISILLYILRFCLFCVNIFIILQLPVYMCIFIFYFIKNACQKKRTKGRKQTMNGFVNFKSNNLK